MTVCILYNHKQQTIQIPNNKHQINAVNLANGLISREEFSARSFVIAWIFSSRPNWLYCSLKNILKVSYQLANLCYGLVKKQSDDAFGF
jgi:hypothetical protein